MADLHALGIVHGAISAEAILVAAGRPPVLDGFGRAGLAGEPGPDGAPLRPADDVAALAELVGQAWRSQLPRRAPRARAAPHRSDLERLLRDATDGRTPPARRLARTLEAVLGPPTDPPTTEPVTDALTADPSPPVGASEADDPFARLRPVEVEPRRRPPRLVALAAGVVGVASLTWGVLGLGSRSPNRPRIDASAATTAPSSAPVPLVTAAEPHRPDPVLVAHHGVLAIGGRRYLVGSRDDQAMAAHWACAGRSQVVLLRPATGELYVFAAWARAGHDVAATPAGRVPAGSRLSSTTDAAGCTVARATAPDGTTHVVRVGRG